MNEDDYIYFEVDDHPVIMYLTKCYKCGKKIIVD